jgi:hypothetical protein
VEAVDGLPSTEDLLRVMTVLGLRGDPLCIMKDHTDERRRAELLAHIAAALVDRLAALETLAGLDVDDRADLHWQADLDAVGAGRTRQQQAARLAWVHHCVARERGNDPDPVAETVAATVGALIALLTGRGGGPMVSDALAGLSGAAVHLATVLRAAPRELV